MTSEVSTHLEAMMNGDDNHSHSSDYESLNNNHNGPKVNGLNVTHKKHLEANSDTFPPYYEYRPEGKPYAIALKQYPVTVHRQLYTPDPNDTLQDPGTARVNIAATRERPEGTTERNWKEDHRRETVSCLSIYHLHTAISSPTHADSLFFHDT